MSVWLLQSRLMPDTCLSLEIPQIQQISALPNESLGKSRKWSMYSSEEGKMQMKTNAKSLLFMFQVPNYAWHFNFPKACYHKIVLNAPRSVKASISPSRGISQVRLSSVWGVKCNQCNHCHSTAPLACRRAMDALPSQLCNRARCKPCGQPISWWQNPATGADLVWWLACSSFCTISGNSGCLPLACGCFTWGSLYYVCIARRSRVPWRSIGEICNH